MLETFTVNNSLDFLQWVWQRVSGCSAKFILSSLLWPRDYSRCSSNGMWSEGDAPPVHRTLPWLHPALFSWLTKGRYPQWKPWVIKESPHQLGFLDECMEQSHLANPKPLSAVRWARNKFKWSLNIAYSQSSSWSTVMIHHLEHNGYGVVVTEGRVQRVVRGKNGSRCKAVRMDSIFMNFSSERAEIEWVEELRKGANWASWEYCWEANGYEFQLWDQTAWICFLDPASLDTWPYTVMLDVHYPHNDTPINPISERRKPWLRAARCITPGHLW